MCVGIPMQVVECAGGVAWCEGRGERRRIDLRLTGPQPTGTWVLTFLGVAREVLTPDRAQSVDQALDSLQAVLRGESVPLDLLFADLIGREPQLPEHLRGASQP